MSEVKGLDQKRFKSTQSAFVYIANPVQIPDNAFYDVYVSIIEKDGSISRKLVDSGYLKKDTMRFYGWDSLEGLNYKGMIKVEFVFKDEGITYSTSFIVY